MPYSKPPMNSSSVVRFGGFRVGVCGGAGAGCDEARGGVITSFTSTTSGSGAGVVVVPAACFFNLSTSSINEMICRLNPLCSFASSAILVERASICWCIFIQVNIIPSGAALLSA